ncbi:MAG TPA: hypothetical protein VED66_01155 [Candidatus Sulfotelmatobacter sp.]|nr:hypothetical protein [Candidatus Sulfotelmatobacter sp.]
MFNKTLFLFLLVGSIIAQELTEDIFQQLLNVAKSAAEFLLSLRAQDEWQVDATQLVHTLRLSTGN